MFCIVLTVFNVHMIMNHDYFGKENENHSIRKSKLGKSRSNNK